MPLRDVSVFFKDRGHIGVFLLRLRKKLEILLYSNVSTPNNPVTTIYKFAIIKALKKPNVVTQEEIVTSKVDCEVPKKVFMVFEYLEYNLTGIVETPKIC